MSGVMRWPDCRQLRSSDSRPAGVELVTREMPAAGSGKTSRLQANSVALVFQPEFSSMVWQQAIQGDMGKACGTREIQQYIVGPSHSNGSSVAKRTQEVQTEPQLSRNWVSVRKANPGQRQERVARHPLLGTAVERQRLGYKGLGRAPRSQK